MLKLTLKRGEEDRELDLEKPEDLQKAKELAEKGWAYEKGQTQLNDVLKERDKLQEEIQIAKSSLDTWNTVLKEAQEGKMEKLNESLKKMNIKIPVTKADDDQFIQDEGDKVIQALQSKIDNLTKQIDTRLGTVEGAVFTQYMDTEHARLEAKFNGKDGWPVYDRKAVYDYSVKAGINDMEAAYRNLNFEKIIEAQEAIAAKHNEKIRKVHSYDPDGGGEPPKPPKVFDRKSGGYEAANREWQKEMHEQGKSLYKDDI